MAASLSLKNIFTRVKEYLTYYLKTRFKFNIHSPFVYDFVDRVLDDEVHYHEYDSVEQIHEKLKLDDTKIIKTDYGKLKKDGSPRMFKTSIMKLAKKDAVDVDEGRLLFRMINYYKPEYILELGTSLGISTLYMALAAANCKAKKLISLEGCPNIHKLAEENINQLSQTNNLNFVSLKQGAFSKTFSESLQEMPKIDFAFFDGHHTKNAVLNYFENALPLTHEDSILVFDDIYNSRQMKKAWKEIKKSDKVTTTIDLYRLGIVFFNNKFAKQDFKIRF